MYPLFHHTHHINSTFFERVGPIFRDKLIFRLYPQYNVGVLCHLSVLIAMLDILMLKNIVHVLILLLFRILEIRAVFYFHRLVLNTNIYTFHRV